MRVLSRGIAMLCLALAMSCNAPPAEDSSSAPNTASEVTEGSSDQSAEGHVDGTSEAAAVPLRVEEEVLEALAAPGPMALPYAGGTGGSAYRAVCPPHHVVVGVRGFEGNVVDGVDVVCAPLDAASDPSQERELARIGGDGGDAYEQHCAGGQVSLGMAGGAGAVVDSMSLICGPAQSNADVVELPPVGGGGGESYVQRCQVGSVMVGMQGGAGVVVDSLQVLCDTVARVQAGEVFPDDIQPTHLSSMRRDPGGYLGVSSSPRGTVWVNGESTGERTPMRLYPVDAGPIVVQVQYDSGRMSEEKAVLIREDVLTNVFFREAAPDSNGSGSE